MICFSHFISSTLLLLFFFSTATASSQSRADVDDYTYFGSGRINCSNCILLNTTALSQSICVYKCHSNSSCYGLSYDPTTQTCLLHSVYIDGIDPASLLSKESQYRTVVRKMDLTPQFRRPLPNSFPVGSTLYVNATIWGNASGAGFFLQNTIQSYITIMISLRFVSPMPNGSPGNAVAYNALNWYSWGAEEYSPQAPFFRGVSFQLTLKCVPPGYYLYVNGTFHSGFGNRNIAPTLAQEILFFDAFNVTGIRTTYNAITATPYTLSLPNSFPTGSSLFVNGTLLGASPTVAVYLLNTAGNNYPLAFAIRFPQQTARNAMVAGTWGTEELTNAIAPFTIAMDLQLVIKNLPDAYYVYVNGVFYCSFVHRVNWNYTQQALITNDIALTDVHVSYNTLLTVPYTQPLTSGFPTGSMLTIKGTPRFNATGFYAKLWQTSTSYMPFYINPRFKTGTGVALDQVAINTIDQTGWGTEIDLARLPFFNYGVDFEMTIKCNTDAFNIYVNGVFFSNFTHRMDANISNQFTIDGDLVLTSVQLN